MKCPQCLQAEVTLSGLCPACGFRSESSEHDAKSRLPSGYAASQSATNSAQPAPRPATGSEEEIPEWRRELTRRLQRIKDKREQEAPALQTPVESPSTAPAQVEGRREAGASIQPVAGPPRRQQKARARRIETKTEDAQPKPAIEAVLPKERREESLESPDPLVTDPAFETAIPSVEKTGLPPAAGQDEIQSLIDNMVASRGSQAQATPILQELPFPPHTPDTDKIGLPVEDRLILLSRTLSGLIDLIVVFICTCICIFAADIVSGIVIFDRVSILNYSLLFIAVFFLYSTFFLGTTNQTIGMMITELRLVDDRLRRPGLGRIFARCSAYLLSLIGLGVGLIWGIFNPHSACLHDRLSKTKVVRLSGLSIPAHDRMR